MSTMQQVQTTPPRQRVIEQFLDDAGWGKATLHPLAGDASFRRYIRLTDGTRRAMLMDAPPEKENVKPYMSVRTFLHGLGYSAPACLAENPAEGLLLLEDLGDDLFTALLAENPDPALERTLYAAAVDNLAEWHDRPELQRDRSRLHLPHYDRAALTRELALFAEWYLPHVAPPEQVKKLAANYLTVWDVLLDDHPIITTTFVHRDYHASNLLWLPERDDVENVGLLDFQDALWGDPAYDLVSLLEDARRDVTPELADAMLARYLRQTGEDERAFRTRYALLGAQRNCKILGIFVRLMARDGKPHYLPHLPRVWRYLAHDLQHPALAPLAAWFETHIPSNWRRVDA